MILFKSTAKVWYILFLCATQLHGCPKLLTTSLCCVPFTFPLQIFTGAPKAYYSPAGNSPQLINYFILFYQLYWPIFWENDLHFKKKFKQKKLNFIFWSFFKRISS